MSHPAVLATLLRKQKKTKGSFEAPLVFVLT
jgi:hypothetical protein